MPKFRLAPIRRCSHPLVTLFAAAAMLLGVAPADAQSPVDRVRNRVTVVNHNVVTAEGAMLRGGRLVIAKALPDATAWAEDRANMRRMRDTGLNVVRVICFDAWEASHGGDAWTVDQVLSHLDTIVDNAAQEGMYVVINYHDVGRYSLDSGPFPLREFWQNVAPRYANRTHVLYETANEPAQWSASAYNATVLNDLRVVDNLIRAAAPSTHIIHLTVSQLYDPLKPLADQYTGSLASYDPAKDSIGIHGYGTNNSATIVALKASYPTIVTEWDYPDREGPIQQIDGELFNGQTFERLGLSWMEWAGGGDSGILSVQEHIDRFEQDARAKGYMWQRENFDFATNVAPSARSVSASGFVSGQEAAKGIDGYSLTSRRWASGNSGDKWLALDLGATYRINRWVVRHAGGGGDLSLYNTRDFKLQKSADGVNWQDSDTILGNTQDITDRLVPGIDTRYIRLYITTPNAGADDYSRISDFELYCETSCGADGGGSAVPANRSAFSQIEAETADSSSGVVIYPGAGVGNFDGGDWLGFSNVAFGSGASGVNLRIAVDSGYAGQWIDLRLDSPSGTLVGSLQVASTSGWSNYETQSATVSGATGTHDLYLVGRGSAGIGNIDWFNFTGASNLTLTALNYSAANGVTPYASFVGGFDDGDWIKFNGVDLGTGYTTADLTVAVDPAYAGQTFDLRIDGPSGQVIGTLVVASTGGWTTFATQSTSLAGAAGVHDVYLVARGNAGVGNVSAITFH